MIKKILDFFIRITIILTIFINLQFFGVYYGRFELLIISLLFLIAVIIAGILDIIEVSEIANKIKLQKIYY